MAQEQLKILVLRFSSIGDIVLTTPVIRNLKKKGKKTTLHFLTKKVFQGVLIHNPYVDKLWCFEQSPQEVLPFLIKQDFDYVIDLHKNIRTLKLKRQLKVKSFSFDKQNVNKFLLTSFKLNYMPERHIVDRYMDCVLSLGVKNDQQGLDYFTNPESEQHVSEMTKEVPKPYVVVVMGAAHKTKVPPVEKYKEILQALDKNYVLIGGKGDAYMAAQIAATKGVRTFNFCGKTSLDQSALMIQQAALVITPDTGMMHVAAAYKKPIVSLWGNTVPEFGMTPYYGAYKIPSFIAQVQNLSCRPCSKIGYDSCSKGHFNCMNQIDVSAIKDWVDQTF